MHFDWVTFGLQTVNFLILVWLLNRFLYRPVLRLIEARRQQMDQKQEEVEHLRAEAAAALADIEKQRHDIISERAAALAAAVAEADKVAEAHRLRAEDRATEIIADARHRIAEEEAGLAGRVRRMSVDLGVDIARRLLAEIPVEQRAEAWLQRVEKHLAAETNEGRSSLIKGVASPMPLLVVTAVPLSADVEANWRSRLTQALAMDCEVRFSVNAELVAGVELQFPGAILHFSWREQIARLLAEIERDVGR